MPKGRSKKTQKFRRQGLVEELRYFGDARWKKAARLDLQELAEDEEGLDRLAKVIRSILRADKQK